MPSYLELKLYLCAVIILAFPRTPEGALDYDDWLSTFDGTIEWTPDLVNLNKTTDADDLLTPSSTPLAGQLEHPLLDFVSSVCADFAIGIVCSLVLLVATSLIVVMAEPLKSLVGRLTARIRSTSYVLATSCRQVYQVVNAALKATVSAVSLHNPYQRIRSMDAQIEAEQRRYTEQAEAHQRHIAERDAQYRRELIERDAQHQRGIADLQAQLQAAKSNTGDVQLQLEASNQQLEASNQLFEASNQQLEASKHDTARLDVELQESREDYKKLKLSADEALAFVRSLNTEKTSLVEALESRDIRIRELEESTAATTDKLKADLAESEAKRAKMQEHYEARIRLLNNGYTATVNGNMELYLDIWSTQRSLSFALVESRCLTDTLSRLRKEHKTKIDSLKQQLDLVTDRLQEAMSDNQALSVANRALSEKYEDLFPRFKLLEALYRDAEECIQSNTVALAAARAGAKVDDHIIDMLSATIEENEWMRAVLEDELAELRTEIPTLRTSLAVPESLNDSLEANDGRTEASSPEVDATIEHLNQTIRTLNTRHDDAIAAKNRELEEKDDEIEQLHEIITEARKEAQTQSHSSQNKIRELQESYVDLFAQLKNLEERGTSSASTSGSDAGDSSSRTSGRGERDKPLLLRNLFHRGLVMRYNSMLRSEAERDLAHPTAHLEHRLVLDSPTSLEDSFPLED